MFTFSQSDRVVNTGHPSDYITLLQNNEDLIVRIFTEERNRLKNIKVRMVIKMHNETHNKLHEWIV